MLFLIFLFIGHWSFCNCQEFNNDEDCNETKNCVLAPHCIKNYSELDFHITNNKELLATLTEAFFRSGKRASAFVKLNYDFQSFTNESANNKSIGYKCTRNQTTYIWSESLLYILGPKPLFWLTLFAVHAVDEVSVTIELPCLCGEVQFDLLSRLTYLVSTVAR